MSLLPGASALSVGVESPWCWQESVPGQRWGKQRRQGPAWGPPRPQGRQPLRESARSPLSRRPPFISPCPSLPSFFSASPSSIPSICVPLLHHLPDSHSLPLPLSPVATVNDLACRGLDKLEEKLPFLQQPSEMVWHRSWGSAGGGSGREESCLPQTQPEPLCQVDSRTKSGFGQCKKHHTDENTQHPA